MHNEMIKYVFKVIAALLITLILFSMIMGSAGRTFMWRAIEPAVQDQWSKSTMRDGRDMGNVYESLFDKSHTYVNPR